MNLYESCNFQVSRPFQGPDDPFDVLVFIIPPIKKAYQNGGQKMSLQ